MAGVTLVAAFGRMVASFAASVAAARAEAAARLGVLQGLQAEALARVRAAEAAAGHKAFFDARVIPSVAYTDPEVAWVGLTEEEAAKQGVAIEKATFPWAASGRTIANGRTIHPHPTLGETIGMAAEVFEGTCTDLPPAKRR